MNVEWISRQHSLRNKTMKEMIGIKGNMEKKLTWYGDIQHISGTRLPCL